MRLECGCPDNYPEWDGENIDLSGQPVHIMPIPTFLHMPLSFETFLSRQWHEIEQLGLKEKWPGLVLSQTGFFRGKIISLLESGDSPARHVQYLPMHFHMRGMLHKGNIGSTKESISKLQSVIFDEGHMPKELFLCYLTCPRCSERRGGDKILLLRRWVESTKLNLKRAN